MFVVEWATNGYTWPGMTSLMHPDSRLAIADILSANDFRRSRPQWPPRCGVPNERVPPMHGWVGTKLGGTQKPLGFLRGFMRPSPAQLSCVGRSKGGSREAAAATGLDGGPSPKSSADGRLALRVFTVRAAAVAAVLVGMTLVRPSAAAVVFDNGFESGDISDWDYALNPEGLGVVMAPEPVLAGTYALRAELTSQTVWNNGIFRTELQYKPDESRVAEGAELYFGWSIYLPEELPAGDYQFGYFETRNTYEQVLSLHAEGSTLALYVNRDGDGSPSNHPGVLEAGTWHRLVYQVKWSSNKDVGFVSLWLDGVKLVDEMHGTTHYGDPALIQFGLLKNPPEPPEPVVIYIDEVMEGDSYAEVSLGIPEGGEMPPPAGDPPEPTPEPSATAAPPPPVVPVDPSTPPGTGPSTPPDPGTPPAVDPSANPPVVPPPAVDPSTDPPPDPSTPPGAGPSTPPAIEPSTSLPASPMVNPNASVPNPTPVPGEGTATPSTAPASEANSGCGMLRSHEASNGWLLLFGLGLGLGWRRLGIRAKPQ